MGRSIGERVRRLDESKTRRQVKKELDKKRISLNKVLQLSAIILGTAFITSMYADVFAPELDTDVNESIEIEDYTFYFVSEDEDPRIEDAWGYTYVHGPNNIWLDQDLLEENLVRQLERTCNHELLHTMGVSGDHHDRIDRYEELIDDPVCNKLVHKVTS